MMSVHWFSLRLTGLFIVLFLVGCGTLQTPEYIGPGEFRRPAGVPNGHGSSISDEIQLAWPVNAVHINQGFKTGPTKRTRHMGIDLGGTRNTPIHAAHDGYIVYTGRDFHGYGRMIILESKDKSYATFYAHLNQITTKEGKYIHAGDVIGKMGRTGHATGIHLHFELRIAQLAVDPTPYLPKRLN
jgi:murein DD-endopeptidase MepM/ murein hydrolase activator NlpD